MKTYLWIPTLALLLLLSACSSSGTAQRASSSPLTVSDVLAAGASEADSSAGGIVQQTESAAPSKAEIGVLADEVEIDLTTMNSTMVYSQVYDMVSHPESYLGKSVRMNGMFSVFEGDSRIYCACVIADATACCAQGIEFVLQDAPSYPDGYPTPGTFITVTGIFDTYMEGSSLYCQLIDAKLVG